MEMARRSLISFGKRVYPKFQDPPHIHFLANLLERAERNEVHKIAISIAPGHGKSTLLQQFLAWFIGREPHRRILAVSASEALARRNSRYVRATMQSPEWPWPDITLTGESLEEWYVKQGGGVRAVGRDGTVTGFRAEMFLADDIQPDGGTDAYRASLEEYFRDILTTRLEPGGIAVVINTRWRDDDIIGRLQSGTDADQWMFVNLPAFALENDVLGRPVGAALWPARFDEDALKLIEATMSSAASFAAQYQGDPVPIGGSLFKPEWFENTYIDIPRVLAVAPDVDPRDAFMRAVDPRPPGTLMPTIKIQAVDSAWKTGVHNDYTVIATLVSDLIDIYIADLWIGKVTYTDLKRVAEEQFNKHQPRMIYVEEASSGYALIDEFRRLPGKIIPVTAVKPGHDDKLARAESVTSWFEGRRVRFPAHASWMKDTVHQFLRFPFGAHDDIVDAIVLGVSQMQLQIARVNLALRDQQQGANNYDNWMGR